MTAGLTCQAGVAPVALASTTPASGKDRSPAGAVAGQPPKEGVAGAADSVPELWTPRAAVIVDSSPPLAADALFDGDSTTGFTSAAGRSGAVRLDLGSAREVIGLGVHGTGHAKIAIYAEDKDGARTRISSDRDAAINLQVDHWAQLALARSTKTAALVVQWAASPSEPAALTELALWVSGRSRQALSEAAIADRLVTELPENATAATAVPWTASVARLGKDGPVSATFDVKLNNDPQLGRAFLVYEVEKKAHWTGAARSINGHVVRGGYRADAKGLGGVQAEEIDPAWLKGGDNSITFKPTLTEEMHGYTIKNVRIVSVPRGSDPVRTPGDRTALSDGDLATGVGGAGVHTSSLSVRADREAAFLSFYLDEPTGGTLTVSAEGGFARAKSKGQVNVDLAGRPAGWQTVPVAGVLPSSGELQLRVKGDRETTGQVSEARVNWFPALSSQADLTVSYPLHGECVDHKTYVRGFASGSGHLKKSHLYVDGALMTGKIDADGSFEANVQEPAASKGKPWSITLEVATEGGGRRTRTVPIDTCLEKPKGRILGVSPPLEDVGAPYGAVVSPQKASTLEFAGAKIEIPAGAVDSDVRVTMRALDPARVKPVEAEMDNVTPSGGGLRFGPHGLTFKKPVRVTLPIEAARMPSGTTSGDVQVFFFNEGSGKWTQVPKVVSQADRIVAETTHFTDFIASTVKSPEHPDAQQFNPNSMKGVKAGEPGAGITLIEQPKVNSKGSANLSYPIETPPGRNGIGPSLVLSYDSDRVHANGWLGVGWDLRIPSIEIDARFGVPKYDGTDIYSLDGAMLAPTATAGTYIRRVEGSFDLIQRVPATGGNPTTYSWKVTDKKGVVSTYGTSANTNNSRLLNPNTGRPANIFRWYLEKVQDTYGNVMTVTYQHDKYSPPSQANESLDGVYPSAIDYTSNGTTTANYHVTFGIDTTVTRPDTVITGRPGFLESTRKRLNDIKIKSGTALVRQYHFYYYDQNTNQTRAQNLADTMQKSVLSAVALWGVEDSASSELYRHTFEYNKAPALGSMFSGQTTWGQTGSANGLSHSNDNLTGGSVTLGVGFPYISVSGSFGMDTGGSSNDLALLGITGQGLPDQIDGSGTLNLNNLLFVPDTAHFTSGSNFNGMANLGGELANTSRSGWTAGGNVSAMSGVFGVGLSYARHVAEENKIITDMNGDGFPDIAYQSGNTVYAYINDKNKNFNLQQWNGYSLASSSFSTSGRLTDPNVVAGTFKTDPLIRWVAPFGGTATITSSAHSESIQGTQDAVRVDSYVGTVGTDATRSLTIPAGDGGANHPFATITNKSISAGDKLYMRTAAQGIHPDNDWVDYETQIQYALPSGYVLPTGKNVTTVTDQVGRPIFRFDSFQDNEVIGFPRVPWHLTGNGDVGVGRCISKDATADELTFSYVIRDKSGTNVVRRWDQLASAAAGTYCFPSTTVGLLQDTHDSGMANILNVSPLSSPDQSLIMEITSNSPVNPDAIRIVVPNTHAQMAYTRYCRPSTGLNPVQKCGTPLSTGNGNYTITNGDADPYPTWPIPFSDIIHMSDNDSFMMPYMQTHVRKIFNNGQNTPQPIRLVKAPSTSVSFTGTLKPNATLTEDVIFYIQGVNKLFKKVKMLAGSTTSQTFSVNAGPFTVANGEAIFFTMYSATAAGANVSWVPTTGTLKMNGTQVTTINSSIQDTTFDNNAPVGNSTHDPMSGGWHGWFYGDWNDSVPFCDNVPVAQPDPCTHRIQRTGAIPQNNDPVIGAIPHDGGGDAMWWALRGEAKIFDFVNFVPGQVSSPIATAGDATSMQALRVSDTWNLSLQATAGITAGISGGDATSQVDFFDFNGDRYPDSITFGGIQLNDGVSSFEGTRRGIDWKTRPGDVNNEANELRKIVNVGMQVGVSASPGGRQVINESNGQGETKRLAASASISGSADYGISSTRIDFVDVNGDGLPDHVRQEPNDTFLRVRLNLGYGFSNEIQWTTPAGFSWGWGQGDTSIGTGWPGVPADPTGVLNIVPGVTRPTSTNVVRMQDTGSYGAQIGASYGAISGGAGPNYSITRTWSDMMDVNGDGLPDQVLKVPGEQALRVKLNTGDGFLQEQSWTLPGWSQSPDPNFSFLNPDGLSVSTLDGWGKNLSFQICFIFCVGASGFDSDSRGGPNMQFEDIDGDGDLDQVMKVPGDANVYVKLNNVINNEFGAAYGPPNLLKAVNRPLGGRIDISYKRSGNHVDVVDWPLVNMPTNQWAMSSVTLWSGYGQFFGATTLENYDYTNWSGYGTGYYDPVEKENYGYVNVKTLYPQEDLGTSIASWFYNQDYYHRGLEYSRSWYQNDAAGVLQRVVANYFWDPTIPDVTTLPPRTGSYFPAPGETDTYFYETSQSYKWQTQTRTYDTTGNLTDAFDYGDSDFNDPNDDFNYHIDYTNFTRPDGTKFTVPTAIAMHQGSVANSGPLLAKRTASHTTGNQPKPDSVTDQIINGNDPDTGTARTATAPGSSTWTFTYDVYGNLFTAASPNHTGTSDYDGNGRTTTYGYDAATKTYVESTSWSDGSANPYTATATYDAKWGQPLTVTDVAGAKQQLCYDNYGRVTKLFAPTELVTGTQDCINGTAPPTIGVTYSEAAHSATGFTESLPAYAVATHNSNVPAEGSLPGGSHPLRAMRTVNFIDGLARSIQVKKDITRDDGNGNLTPGMSVSGPPAFDARGRVFQQGQPFFYDTATPATTYLIGLAINNPTTYAFDVLGRVRQEQHPDSVWGGLATSNISYQLGTAWQDGRTYVVKLVSDPEIAWDPNYHYRAEYTNVRDQMVVSSENNQINGNVTEVWAYYTYDLMGRVTGITDTQGNTTTGDWDSVGHLVDVTSPDSGTREWRYCLNGQKCAELSPNGGLIKYKYDRDRLTTMDYPNDFDVTYTYGAGNAKGTTTATSSSGYKANRVITRTDEAGQFAFDYDSLGDLISEKATLVRQGGGGTTCPVTLSKPTCYASYTTTYTWDNFARVIDVGLQGTTLPGNITTPAETIRYGYDPGGSVASARGQTTTQTFEYVKHVGYNEFGERVNIKYGNDVASTYTYAPDTRRLTQANTMAKDVTGAARQAQGLNFYYDVLGNVTGRYQGLELDPTGETVPVGGYVSEWFSYDPLNQLTSASLYTQGTATADDYGGVNLSYDTIGNITEKDQTDGGDMQEPDGTWTTFSGNKMYNFTPHYDQSPNGYRPHAPTTIDEVHVFGDFATRSLAYDLDGNVTTITRDDGTPQRVIAWTDSDRIKNIKDGGLLSSQALYQADGTRTHNLTSDGETLYVNQYLTIRAANGALLPTKHVYLGDDRVASKIEGNATAFNTYWYHSDQIHSTEYVTTANQIVAQHLEYYPGGEIFREQPTTAFSPLFHARAFTGKELDRSGFYYYGARYYEPTSQLWLSPDPILASYMHGEVNGGVFQQKNLGLYSYTWNNPATLTDPSGAALMNGNNNGGGMGALGTTATASGPGGIIVIAGAALVLGIAWLLGRSNTLAPTRGPTISQSKSRAPKDEEFDQKADDKAKAQMAAAAAAAAAAKGADKNKRKPGEQAEQGDRAKVSDTVQDTVDSLDDKTNAQDQVKQGKGTQIIDRLGKSAQRVKDMTKRIEPKNPPKPLPPKK